MVDVISTLFSLAFHDVCVGAGFPQRSNKTALHVFTPSWNEEQQC